MTPKIVKRTTLFPKIYKKVEIVNEQEITKLNKNYECIICKLYASDFEVPQNRRRVIIIGIRKDLNINPKDVEQAMEKWLWRYRDGGQFAKAK